MVGEEKSEVVSWGRSPGLSPLLVLGVWSSPHMLVTLPPCCWVRVMEYSG